MVKILKYIHGTLSLLIVFMLIIASIVSPALLTSIGYTVVYLLYVALTLLSAFFIQGIRSKILHILLALLIVTVILVKANNDRYPITMGKGGKYLLETDTETLELELVDFSIRHEKGSASAVHYESKLLINDDKPVSITVNHPYKHDNIRLYQSSYRSISPYFFYSNDTLRLFEGQNDKLNDIQFHFLEYDPFLQRTAIKYNDILFYFPIGRKVTFLDMEIMIIPDEPEMATVLEYVEVKGHIYLLIFAILTLVALILIRIRRK
ncbi:MAG: cytochrome c biogenesis protein ResB [Candidatus Marinimicrobia bacterium]|nr:cytochrome c biogenesis protein ResB [Candidatus Neomarinimicrobiota bacterium]